MSDINIKHIKEKLMMMLNGEKAFKYFNNITKPLGKDTVRGNIISGKDGVNCFLINIFRDEKAFVDDEEQNNNSICDLIVYGKRILTRTLSSTGNNYFYLGCFSSSDSKTFNINKFIEQSRKRINNTDYFLLILIDRSKPKELFRVSYNFYLKSVKDFVYDNGDIRSYRKIEGGLYLYVDRKKLGEPLFTYSYNYE